MKNKHFLKTYLLSSILFFLIGTLLDFLATFQTNDALSYILFFALSFIIFGPIIAYLVTNIKEEEKKTDITLQV